jgi:hypothetical protein
MNVMDKSNNEVKVEKELSQELSDNKININDILDNTIPMLVGKE